MRRLPYKPTPAAKLASRLGRPEEELASQLTDMAGRGLILDVEVRGVQHFALAPILGGFFEFLYMRVRDGLPDRELASLLDEVLVQDSRFAREYYRGETQFARTLVREEALAAEIHHEVMDWERVSRLIDTASCLSLGLCACRHKNGLLGKACGAEVRTCISLNAGAEAMIHNAISQRITRQEALRIVETSKANGLFQIGDNVKQGVTFICNCCGCCCTLVNALRTFRIRHAVVSSNWIMAVDGQRCVGCGQCDRVCPVRAISMAEEATPQGPTKRPVLDAEMCLGCGACTAVCKKGAIRMAPRRQRVFVPETFAEKTIRMAIERGRLAELVFDAPETLSLRALCRILSVLEKSPPARGLMAIRPLRSAFLNAWVRR